MFVVKPQMRKSIEGWIIKFDFLINKKTTYVLFLAILRKKRDLEHRGDEPRLEKTEGRFETYTGK
jgi:hypothetical protein